MTLHLRAIYEKPSNSTSTTNKLFGGTLKISKQMKKQKIKNEMRYGEPTVGG